MLIAMFFAWQRRGKAASVQAETWWPGLALVAGISAIWTISSLINVQVIEQFAAIAIISAIFVTLYGPQRTRVFALPLVFLFFAVPFGQGLVPVFMEWTADFTVGALRLFGIPVLREGLYFSTSSGSFYVAEACSGVVHSCGNRDADYCQWHPCFRDCTDRPLQQYAIGRRS
jgi:exosortase